MRSDPARCRGGPLADPEAAAGGRRLETDALLGQVGWYFESEVSGWGRVGIVLYDPRSWSAGRGTEALRLWADHLFATMQVVRLDVATWSGNLAMCRLGARLGRSEEARFRRAREVDGERFDSVVYGVLREEWELRRG